MSKSASSSFANSTRTINPSLLDRQPDFQAQPSQSRTKSALEPVASRRAINSSRDVEPQKISLSNADILSKAVEMGMKVWHLEKLQRILKSMVDMPNEAQAHVSYTSRMKIASTAVKGEREAELSRMIRHEQINGPSDRDATVALSELIPFKGPHIYIRDVNEKTKPIMVREYPKPPRGELGVWPQFRATSQGKCPFVEEDIPPTPEEIEKAIVKAREAEVRTQQDTETRIAPRTRATTTREDAQANNVMRAPQKRPLEETKNKANTAVAPAARMPTQEFCPPPPFIFGKCGSPSKSVRHTLANAGPRLCGGEPAASGLQPSNVTSAIRSQMISSTAAAPGTKSGTSREVHGLKRKVLEKNSGPALNGIQTRQRTLDPAGTARAERNIQISRPSRRQPQKTLIHVDEESTLSEEEDEEDVWMGEDVRAKQKQQKKVLDKKHQKPGYCENCREKYDDFDQVSNFIFYSLFCLMALFSMLLGKDIANSPLRKIIGEILTNYWLSLDDNLKNQTQTASSFSRFFLLRNSTSQKSIRDLHFPLAILKRLMGSFLRELTWPFKRSASLAYYTYSAFAASFASA